MFSRIKRVFSYIHLHGEEGSKGRARQLGELALLAVTHRFSPLEYEAYGFFEKEKDWPAMMTYLSNYEVTVKLRRPLYDKAFLVLLNNKVVFNRFYSSLPLPELYGYLNPEEGFRPDGRPLTNPGELQDLLMGLQGKELFIKPAGGLQGLNVLILKDIDPGSFLSCQGSSCQRWTALDLFDHLFRKLSNQQLLFSGYLIEEYIRQHPALSRINPTSVNTCRVLTIKDREGNIHIPFAFIRFGRTGNMMDNLSQGGVAAGIDVETGVLRKAAHNPKFARGWVSHHPDTGAAIEGFQLPYWEEVKKLAERAATATPGIRTVGWDITLTAEGPVFVEGNSSWTPMALQQHCRGLMTPETRKIFEQYGLKLR